MANFSENKRAKLFNRMMEKRQSQFDYEQLAADIRRKKDDYSLIERGFAGINIDLPSTAPFRWTPEDVGKEMVIVDESGQFGDQRVVELTLTYCKDDIIEFQIDRLTILDIYSSHERFQILDQEEFQSDRTISLKRGQIISSKQLCQMSEFVYGSFGAPDNWDFSLYGLIQYWAHHHVLVQNLHHATEQMMSEALASTI